MAGLPGGGGCQETYALIGLRADVPRPGKGLLAGSLAYTDAGWTARRGSRVEERSWLGGLIAGDGGGKSRVAFALGRAPRFRIGGDGGLKAGLGSVTGVGVRHWGHPFSGPSIAQPETCGGHGTREEKEKVNEILKKVRS